jgi:hypothetical protein
MHSYKWQFPIWLVLVGFTVNAPSYQMLSNKLLLVVDTHTYAVKLENGQEIIELMAVGK